MHVECYVLLAVTHFRNLEQQFGMQQGSNESTCKYNYIPSKKQHQWYKLDHSSIAYTQVSLYANIEITISNTIITVDIVRCLVVPNQLNNLPSLGDDISTSVAHYSSHLHRIPASTENRQTDRQTDRQTNMDNSVVEGSEVQIYNCDRQTDSYAVFT